MPNVTIDITGRNTGGAQPTTPDNGRTTTPGGDSRTSTTDSQDNRQSPIFDPNARLMDDLRRMLIEQASTYQRPSDRYTPIISQIEQAQRQQIANQYEERRQQAQQRMTQRYSDIDRDIDESIDREISTIDDDDEVRRVIDRWEGERDRRYETAGRQYDDDIAAIEEEQTQKEEELSRTIEELTEEIRRSGGNLNPNSFLSQLREQRQQAIIDRDTAEDEETARQAAARVRELDQQIRDIERGGDTSGGEDDEKKIDWGLRTIQTMMGFDQLARGVAGRDLGSIIMGGAQTVTSMLGMSDRGAARSLAWVKPIATIGTLLTQEAQKSDQMAGLAALIQNDPNFGGGSIGATREEMYRRLWDYSPVYDLAGINSMGLSAPEFAQSASRRIRQRGVASDGITEAYYQEALERVFSLDQGALGAAGQYDRYGMNATDAISNLVERLSRIQNSGVSQGNYVRVQEYLNMQQGVMQQLMRFQDRPNIGIANKEIEAFAQLKNYTVDSRTGSDIAAVRNTITNPQNDRMRALLYGTVEELLPETAGRSDLIDRAINDPAKQGEIIRAYMQKIQNMYGGTDTPMGYWAGKALLSSIESPERRDAILRGITSGRAGQTLANGEVINTYNTPVRDTYAKQVEGYTSELTSILIKTSDGLYAGISILENLAKDVKDLVTGTKSLADIVKQRVF